MARIRSIKPDFFTSEDVSVLPLRARLTWIGLWTHCDDHGRTKDVSRLVKAAVWPLDDVSLRDVEEDLEILADRGRIVRYAVEEKHYLAVVNWHVHQAINRPGQSACPAPPVPVGPSEKDARGYCSECSLKTHGGLTEGSLKTHGGLTLGKEGKGREGTREGVNPHGVSRPPDTEPPTRCPTHIGSLDSPPCGACADARREHEAWQRRLTDSGRVVGVQCPDHPDQPAGRCVMCEHAAVPPPRDFRRRPVTTDNRTEITQ